MVTLLARGGNHPLDGYGHSPLGLGIVIMPWRLLSDYGTYVFGWLAGYSGLLGRLAGRNEPSAGFCERFVRVASRALRVRGRPAGAPGALRRQVNTALTDH